MRWLATGQKLGLHAALLGVTVALCGWQWNEHRRFREAYQKRWKDYPRLGSVVGYTAVHAVAAALRKAGSDDSEKLVEAMKGLQMPSPFGPVTWRALDHQATMGAYVGQLSKKSGQGVMVNWRFADGAQFLPGAEEVKALRKE